MSFCREDIRTPHFLSVKHEPKSEPQTSNSRDTRPRPSPSLDVTPIDFRPALGSTDCGFGLMRYRSATVTGSDGLPLFYKISTHQYGTFFLLGFKNDKQKKPSNRAGSELIRKKTALEECGWERDSALFCRARPQLTFHPRQQFRANPEQS